MAKTQTTTKESFLDEVSGQGFENITQDDRALPFLRVLQLLSPQLDEDKSEYIKGAKVGQFFNTVTKHVYGTEIDLIPLYYDRSWMEWLPERKGLVGRHVPASIEVDRTKFSQWKYGDNIIQDTLMFYCLIPDHIEEGPLLFSLQSSGVKHGKNWNTNIIMKMLPSGKPAPYFGGVWHLESTKESSDQGTFYQIGGKSTNISFVRLINKTEYIDYVKPAVSALKSLESRVDYAQLEGGADKQDGEDVADAPY